MLRFRLLLIIIFIPSSDWLRCCLISSDLKIRGKIRKKKSYRNSPHSPSFCLVDPSLHFSLALSLLSFLCNQHNKGTPSDVTNYHRGLPKLTDGSSKLSKLSAFTDSCEEWLELPLVFSVLLSLTNKRTYLGVQVSGVQLLAPLGNNWDQCSLWLAIISGFNLIHNRLWVGLTTVCVYVLVWVHECTYIQPCYSHLPAEGDEGGSTIQIPSLKPWPMTKAL